MAKLILSAVLKSSLISIKVFSYKISDSSANFFVKLSYLRSPYANYNVLIGEGS